MIIALQRHWQQLHQSSASHEAYKRALQKANEPEGVEFYSQLKAINDMRIDNLNKVLGK